MEYEIVVGLEVHCQLSTRTKLFCSCANSFTLEPNSHTCPGCLAMPGALPVLNHTALEYAIRASLALNCNVDTFCRFERKHYFYPDLPAGFQTSQLQHAVGHNGFLLLAAPDGRKRVGINRVQLEEDAGKLLHEGAGTSGIDLNRVGSPLIEIVSEPDMRSAAEAKAYLELLRQTLMYCGVSDCNMEEGSLRCDANVSVHPKGSDKFGTRNEIKNLNSFRAVESAVQAMAAELMRRTEDGETIRQTTWGYNLDKARLYEMRTKETARDYRYSPAPDLPLVPIDPAWVEDIRSGLPELPAERKLRLIEEQGLSEYDAGLVTQDKPTADYYEEVAKLIESPKDAANWMINEVARELNSRALDITDFPLKPKALADLVGLVRAKKINLPTARQVMAKIAGGDAAAPGEIVKRDKLGQISDGGAIKEELESIVAANLKQAMEIQNGKLATAQWFVGQLMKAMKGKADPAAVTQAVAERFGLSMEVFQKKKKE